MDEEVSELSYGSPEAVGLLSGPFETLHKVSLDYLTPRNYGDATFNAVHPLYPGAVVLVGHRKTIVSHFAVGQSLLYADVHGVLLPEDKQRGMQLDTVFDIASLTKLFTTILILDQVGKGKVDLNTSVATYLPDFAVDAKCAITVLQLLTHTSGLPALPHPPLTPGYASVRERRKAVLAALPETPAGTKWLYSDINFMTLGFLLEVVSGQPLDALLEKTVTGARTKMLLLIQSLTAPQPLGMVDTFFNRGNGPKTGYLERTIATEFQRSILGPVGEIFEPLRPQPVQLSVHDENCWALDGVSGHAGLFSTAIDLAALCQMILGRGTLNGKCILEPWTVDLIFNQYSPLDDGYQGLGFRLDVDAWSGPMKSLNTATHTGYVGTTVNIDRESDTFWLHLTNRVHPSRTWSNTNIARQETGRLIAQALGQKTKLGG
ncbi:putative beta-lactamase [Naematelia encephala]|uniref:Putative beta-lactamase n=1 Tax=Naematelia encephala TaxID=71784 RepID=A0A1Y2AG55_9TREE|nr:putative beta-lactamase [Naematelia encephala]